jgi:hypothetical protein
MELIPVIIVAMLGAVFALAVLVAGAGRAPGGAHVAESALGARREVSWRAPRRATADS